MLFESLALNLGVTAGDTPAFFTEPADVGAALPVEEGCGILAEGIITGD